MISSRSTPKPDPLDTAGILLAEVLRFKLPDIFPDIDPDLIAVQLTAVNGYVYTKIQVTEDSGDVILQEHKELIEDVLNRGN